MGRIIAITNQKGGVGKTTTAINLGASLAAAERPTLLIDLDPQSNTTSGLGIGDLEQAPTMYEVLAGEVPLDRALVSTDLSHLLLAPSTPDLFSAEIELIERRDREFMLRRALEPIGERFDYVFIDTPPSLGLLTINAIAAADSVLVPLQCEYYALEGLSILYRSIDMVRQGLNPRLDLEGILLTMADQRTNLSRQVEEQTREVFGARVFETVIPRNVRLSEAPSFGRPVLLYDINSTGAQAYLRLAKELMSHEAKSPGARARSALEA